MFSSDKYENIKQVNVEYPLNLQDLKVTCTDTQYQKVTFLPARENLFARLVEGGKAGEIISQCQTVAANLSQELARDLSLDQIREKLGKGGAPSPVSGGGVKNSGDPNFDDLLGDVLKD